MADDLDGRGYNVVVRNGKERGRGVYRNVPYEFAITLPRQDVVDTLISLRVGILLYAPRGYAKKRVHKR